MNLNLNLINIKLLKTGKNTNILNGQSQRLYFSLDCYIYRKEGSRMLLNCVNRFTFQTLERINWDIIYATTGKKTKEAATVLKHESIKQNGIRRKTTTILTVNVRVLNCPVTRPKFCFYTEFKIQEKYENKNDTQTLNMKI